MVVKVKNFFEKIRHAKKNDKPKNTFYEDKEMQDIMKQFYLLKRSPLFSRLNSVQKGERSE